MGTMKVNFNGVRKQALYAYDSLCSNLNDRIDDGEVRIPVDIIKKDMAELKKLIGVIACTFEPDTSIFDALNERE